jgi:predicted nucleic acid-binding protein
VKASTVTAVIVDTNVLIYAADRSAGFKHARATELLRTLGESEGSAAISTQVLSEYANVATHPAKLGLSPQVAMKSVRALELLYPVLPVTADTVVAALEACERWQLSYYDAQIWAAAALAGVPVVLSEDFSDGSVLGGVRFVDPFAKGFDVAKLLSE